MYRIQKKGKEITAAIACYITKDMAYTATVKHSRCIHFFLKMHIKQIIVHFFIYYDYDSYFLALCCR